MNTQLEFPKGKPRGRRDEDRPNRRRRDETFVRVTERPGRAAPEKPPSRLPKKAPGRDLRMQYHTTMEIAFVLALLVVLGLVHAPLRFEDAFEYTVDAQEIVQMEEVTQTKQIEQPPPPPRPPIPVEVPNDAILDFDEELDLDAALDIDAPLAALPPPPSIEAPRDEPVKEVEAEIFVVVEEMPELIGGVAGLAAQIRYPEVALRAGVEGRVIVQFVIDEQGRPSDFVVIRGQGAGLDEEAIRVLQLAKFKPGKQRGKAVKVRMTMPVTFRLREARKS